MSQLSDIVSITITRETQALSIASFDTPAIISEFASDKTATTFDRTRTYASLTEMTDDNWSSTDQEYIRAALIFSQNPHPSSIMIGRKKPDTEAVETWTEALTAIQADSGDWYAFTINSTQYATVTFAGDFVSSNSIVATINGVACDAVVYSSDQQTTMGLLETEIEGQAGLENVSVTIGASPYRTMTITAEEGDISTVSFAITGGISQTTYTTAFVTEDDQKLAAAWAETQKKIYFLTSDASDIPTSATDDLFSDLKALNYDRTVMCYHSGLSSDDMYMAEAWMGECMPYDPGSQTWSFKTLTGITAYNLTSSQRTYILGKYGNIYTSTAGISNTENGKVASGEYIDIIRGIDWLEARIAENIFSELINTRKIPFTDEGIAIIEGLLREILNEAVGVGLITNDYEVSVPKAADVSSANKLARTLPDITFTATLQGAIHYVTLSGTVSV
jgi:hypothetical protein